MTLLEYSLTGVTEGIDAIATTRVSIRGENGFTSTQATGEKIRRTFRYRVIFCSYEINTVTVGFSSQFSL